MSSKKGSAGDSVGQWQLPIHVYAYLSMSQPIYKQPLIYQQEVYWQHPKRACLSFSWAQAGLHQHLLIFAYAAVHNASGSSRK